MSRQYLPETANNSHAALVNFENFLEGGGKTAATMHGKPHPYDYNAKIIDSMLGPQWEIEESWQRERFWRDMAFHYYAKANNLFPTEDNK